MLVCLPRARKIAICCKWTPSDAPWREWVTNEDGVTLFNLARVLRSTLEKVVFVRTSLNGAGIDGCLYDSGGSGLMRFSTNDLYLFGEVGLRCTCSKHWI